MDITEKVSGRESQNYATGLNNLSLLLSKLSDYENAMKHQELAVKIMEQIGFESKYLYMFKHNLFVYYKEKGDLSKSLAMSLALEKEVLKNLGDFNPLYFSILHHQAMCYKSLGNWQKNVDLNLRCLELRKVFHGIYHPDTYMSYFNYTSTFNQMDNQEERKAYIDTCLLLSDSIFGPKSEMYAFSLSEMAGFNKDNNKLLLAEETLQEVIVLLTNILGDSSLRVADQANSLAQVYTDMSNYNEAINYTKHALGINEYVWGASHVGNVTYWSNLIWIYLRMNAYNSADSIATKSLNLLYADYIHNLSSLTENERQDYKLDINNKLYALLNYSIFRQRSTPDLYSTAYQYWINMNGLLSNSSSKQAEQIKRSNDDEVIKLYDNYRKLSKQISLYNEKPKEHLHQLGIDMIALDEQVALLERELNAKVSGFSNDKKQYTYTDLTKGLNRHEVFIDIIALPLIDTASWNWTSELRYLVNISSPKWDTPKHMVIENAEGLMELSHDYANRIHGNDEPCENALILRDVIMISFGHQLQKSLRELKRYTFH